METIGLVLLLLSAVVVSGIVSRMLPLPLPRPLFQIALGFGIGMIADWRVSLDPEIFFLLFLPPLLFLDGWRIPREELLKDSRTVLALALGLVFFTVAGMGFFINWMIPSMPLTVAFALAAVISPTDPIAVTAIAKRVPIPRRIMHILEGESLLNDASGLVCLRFAIAAALTGVFSIQEAALEFLWMALGGIAAGTATAWGITRAKRWVVRRYGEETGSQILVSLLIPFAAYLLAEQLHCSGILAAVAAGLTMSVVESSDEVGAITRIRRNSLWDTIQFAANGVIFVLLGEQLPAILAGAAETVQTTGHHEPWWLAVYVVAINAGLAALRFLWVWFSVRRVMFRSGEGRRPTPWRMVSLMTLAGVRGAITLAGVLTVPLAMADGTAFPARDVAIFLAMGVIVTSLIVASIGLPWLLRGFEMPADISHQDEEDAARVAAAEAAITAIEESGHEMARGRPDADVYVAAAARIMEMYRQRIERSEGSAAEKESLRAEERIERDLRLAALKAERDEIASRVRQRALGSETARKLEREIDLLEARFIG